MKRIILILPILIIMSACSFSPAKLQTEFNACVESEYNEVKIKADIKSQNHKLQIEMKKPDNLDGYIYIYNNSRLTVKYKELELESESEYLPKNAFTNILYYVLSSIKKGDVTFSGENGEKAEYNGKCKSGNFVIHSDYNSGYISDIELKSLGFKAHLKNK